ncbi:MAG: purine-nucleoside phosphorylase [Oscillospiraceae bacterium]
MSEFKGTPHNTAKKGDVAKTVLMPGDPLRAKFIADTFLENVVQFNSVRGMLGFTGTYKGKPVSVMGSGMGMPSIGIYSYELFKFYDVDNIIRVGSAGSYTDKLNLFDVVLATSAYSESTFAKVQSGYDKDVIEPSPVVNQALEVAAAAMNKPIIKAMIHSSDVFYSEIPENAYETKGAVCVEMESFALFANAKATGKNGACLVTISDNLTGKKEETTAEERQTAFVDMMEIALNAAISL